ncbi:hypothetical protein, partial [Flavobacterium sp.]|uniref:hypothetical protein n=1 Tax=Flavobacterium sp. TaxID=239 RepID=UPI0037BEA156
LKRQELQKSLDEAKKLSTQAKFEKHLAKHGYDVAEKGRYWDQKIKDIDAQIAAWDAEMAARKAKQGVGEAQSMGTALRNTLSRAEPGSKLDKKIRHHNDLVRRFGPDAGVMTSAPDGYHIDKKGFVRLGEKVTEVSPELKQRYLDKAYPAHGDYNMARRQTTGKEQEHYARKEKNTKAGIKRAVGEQGVAEGSKEDANFTKWMRQNYPDAAKSAETYAQAKKHYAQHLRQKYKDHPAYKEGVAEEYDPSYDPDYRPYEKPEQDPDAWKQQRDLEEPASSTSTVTVKDLDGNVVLTFPSTGGYYGDVSYAKSKGFDTEAGNYDIKWNKGVAESGQGDDSTSPVGGNVQESYWKKLQQDRFVKEHKKALSMLGELKEIFKDK